MKVLVIGRDPNLFKTGSESYGRIKEYAGLFDEYHIINMVEPGHKEVRDGKLFIWPTNSWFLGWAWLSAFRLGKGLVQKYKLEIIDAQDPAEAGLAAFLVAKFSRLPLHLQIHTDILSPWYRYASWKDWFRYRLAIFLIPRADYLRVVSERIKRSILKLGVKTGKLKKISVLPIFTDLSKFRQAQRNLDIDQRFKDYDFKIISVGRLVDKEKNFNLLIKVMARLVKIYPKVLLVLLGEGPDKIFYQKEIQDLKLEKNVIIEGWRSDFPSFYKSFDLFLLSSNYEGWGRVVVEAMAAGLPIVMTDVGLAGEVVVNESNGIVVPVGEEKAILETIGDLYKNPEKRLRLVRAAENTAKNLEPGTREEYLSLYKKDLEEL